MTPPSASPSSTWPRRARLEPKIPLREGLMKTIDYFKSIDFDAFRAPTPNY
jgi:hypothetical protein